jgi:hypothetical protein
MAGRMKKEKRRRQKRDGKKGEEEVEAAVIEVLGLIRGGENGRVV